MLFLVGTNSPMICCRFSRLRLGLFEGPAIVLPPAMLEDTYICSINKHVMFHGLSVDHPPSAVMTDDTPFATAFHAAAPKGHRKMKGEPHEKFENISQ
jgi:hypothetical protein